MSDLRINDRKGTLREAVEAERARLKSEGIDLSFSQAAHRLIHLGKRALENTSPEAKP
tara:strand:- start:2519 stop:2692 length:174 start_codon:yes stop_codon:yes gene_type:complete